MDPNDNDQNPMGPTDVPQGPASDDGQGVPAAPQTPPPPPPQGEGRQEEELPPPPPVETPSDVPTGDGPQTA